MACFLPFRPWHSPDPRVFRFRTTWDQSTNPTQVLSCTYAPPQWLAPSLVAPTERIGRPFLLHGAPRIAPRPFSMTGQKNPFLRSARDQTFGRLYRTTREPRLQGLATLLAVSAPLPSGTCFSPPRSWASLFRAFLRLRGGSQVSPEPSALTLCCQTLRPGTGAPAASAHQTSRSPCFSTLFRWKWGPCPLELWHLPGFFHRTFEEAPSFFMPFPLFHP